MLSLTVRAILVKERLSSRSSGGPSSGSWPVLPVASSSVTAEFSRCTGRSTHLVTRAAPRRSNAARAAAATPTRSHRSRSFCRAASRLTSRTASPRTWLALPKEREITSEPVPKGWSGASVVSLRFRFALASASRTSALSSLRPPERSVPAWRRIRTPSPYSSEYLSISVCNCGGVSSVRRRVERHLREAVEGGSPVDLKFLGELPAGRRQDGSGGEDDDEDGQDAQDTEDSQLHAGPASTR